jgi:hypothetical protein
VVCFSGILYLLGILILGVLAGFVSSRPGSLVYPWISFMISSSTCGVSWVVYLRNEVPVSDLPQDIVQDLVKRVLSSLWRASGFASCLAIYILFYNICLIAAFIKSISDFINK